MKVYLAAITHKNGLNLLAGGSKEELLWKLAGYCRAQPLTDWCGETTPTEDELLAMTDEQVVEAYFTGHPAEFVDEDSDEIKQPTVADPELAAFIAECSKSASVVKGRSRGH